MKKLHSLLLKQEISILHDEFSDNQNKLLGDTLWEIAADGTSHTREEICEWLSRKSINARWEIKKFKVQNLSRNLALTTYWAKMLAPKISDSNGNLHCSIWQKNNEGQWQMVFHQATKVI